MKTRPIAAFLFAFLLSLYLSSAAGAAEAKRVFIVHSYGADDICGQPQHDGVVQALQEAGYRQGENLDMGVYYMDTKRTNNTPELIAGEGQRARQAAEAFRSDVLVTLDDTAFHTVALPLAGRDQVAVFSGMNEQPENYNAEMQFMADRQTPGGNVTGVYEKLYVRDAIKVLAKILPLKKILFLVDLSPTGKAVKGQIDLELQPAEGLPAAVEQKTIHNWEEFCETVTAINRDPAISAFYLGTLLLRDKKGHTYTVPEMIGYIIDHATKPAMGLNYAFTKLGLFGGATVDFQAMGHLAGRKVVQILDGAAPGSLPIEDAPRVALVFNTRRLKSLGIELPEDILLAADEVFEK